MFPIKIALVSKVTDVQFDELSRVATALTMQVSRDVTPLWGIAATVEAFHAQFPPGYWPMFVVANLPPTEGGFHLTKHNQPYAKVEVGAHWSLAASHELIEMLVDPSGNRLVAGPELQVQNGHVVENADKRVEYLVEACDPCEAPDFAYIVEDVIVSDFFTPHYHDPVVSPGTKYSFTGALKKPRDVLKGGYISWFDPENQTVRQVKYIGNSPVVVDPEASFENAAQKAGRHLSLREYINNHTRTETMLSSWAEKSDIAKTQKVRHTALQAASKYKTSLYPV